MPTEQDIQEQQEQLRLARLALQGVLQQLHEGVTSDALLRAVEQISEASGGINQAKAQLRAWGVAVADHPDDLISDRDVFAKALHLNVTVQQKGLFGEGATFNEKVIAYQENVHLPPPPEPMPLGQALALLEELPLDDLPAPQPLPDPHRILFGTNPLFVGRADELRHIAAQLKAGATVAVTTGLGGVGKTQLASELAHRYGRYFGGGVFWLSFATPSAIASEVAACGRLMGAFHDAEKLDLDAQVQRTQARWASGPPCLLIFDNCEDEELLREWQPKTGQCRVLVTSRHQGAWSHELSVQPLSLDVLAREESIQLLQQLAPRLSHHEADLIARELGDLPLALHLAGRYLASYTLAVTDYLAKLRSPDLLKHRSLIGHGVKALPTERKPHVARAFALSFDRLAQDDPADVLACQFLARAACFAPGEPFAQNWLEAAVAIDGDEEDQQVARTDAANRLLGLGLLEQEGAWLRLHRLLAAYSQNALSDVDALPAVEQVVIWVAYLASETKIPQTMLPVLPHLRHLVRQVEGREDEVEVALYANLGSYLDTVGAYGEALPLYERALEISERVLGSEHPDTAQSLNNLAELYRVQGAYERAMPLYERALAVRERVLGSEHSDTAQSLNNLAELYRVQGIYERAMPLYERALAVRERVLGSEHPDTATSLNNLALLFQAQGEDERAMPLLERALAVRERVLGSEHPDTATSLNNLALLFQAQGEDERAMPLLERALAVRERVLGSEHPDTAMSLNNLAALHYAQGVYERAMPLLERALGISERVLGSEHPDTAMSLNNLALLHYAQGAYERAMSLYERVLAVRERVLGSEHPDTAQSLNNLAGLHYAQGAYERALPLLERALAVRERMLGSEHPDTAQSLNNLAVLHASQGEFALALPLLQRAIRIREARLGAQHPDMVQAQQSFAAMRRAAVVAALPEAVRSVFQAQDRAVFQQALQALPPEEARALIQQLIEAGLLPKPDADPFAPLLQAIAAVAGGNDRPRAQVEAALVQLEQNGYHLTAAVQEIWAGQRDLATLTAGLDNTDRALITRVLALLEEAESAKQRADLLARAEAAVATVGDEPQARAALTEKLLTVAASYASGIPEDRAVAAQLQALAEQIKGRGG